MQFQYYLTESSRWQICTRIIAKSRIWRMSGKQCLARLPNLIDRTRFAD